MGYSYNYIIGLITEIHLVYLIIKVCDHRTIVCSDPKKKERTIVYFHKQGDIWLLHQEQFIYWNLNLLVVLTM